MRLARLAVGENSAKFAWIHGGKAQPLTAAPWHAGVPHGAPIAFDEASLMAPVIPAKILCVGRNYAAHARELGNEIPKEPLLFLKPSSAVVGPGEDVILPKQSARVEHEAELGVVIKARCKSVRSEDALQYVFGYTCVGDITARDLQKADGQWSRAKGFDTFCPVGPWVETELDASDLRICCQVNGETRQDGRTSHMIFDVPTLVAYASSAMTLEPGDLLVTGTPEGVGPLAAGDSLCIAIEGIGELNLGVRKSDS